MSCNWPALVGNLKWEKGNLFESSSRRQSEERMHCNGNSREIVPVTRQKYSFRHLQCFSLEFPLKILSS